MIDDPPNELLACLDLRSQQLGALPIVCRFLQRMPTGEPLERSSG
ncbi:MAG: hypothetical protein ACRDNS_24530 [Trebonia sp.]